MQIKTSSSKTLFYLVALLLILFSFNLNFKEINETKHNISEWLISQDLGFSSIANLSDTSNGKWVEYGYTQPLLEKGISLIASIPKVIRYKISNDNDFPKLNFDIKFTDYQQILKDRQNALSLNQLLDAEFVKAKVTYNGKKYSAKVRLKGDLSGHWLTKRRMSLRVKLKGGKTILGYKEFSIQKPRERQYPYDFVHQKILHDLGNLSGESTFVKVIVNGQDWGVMNIEEFFSKGFLEKKNRKESLIFKFSRDEDTWKNNFVPDPYYFHKIYDTSLYAKTYQKKNIVKNYIDRERYSYIVNKNKNFPEDIYDVNSLTKSYILALTWGNFHNLRDNNTRYYLNPYTLKLEAISLDQHRYLPLPSKLHEVIQWPLFPQFFSVFNSQAYSQNLEKNLSEVSKAIYNLPKHLKNSKKIFPLDHEKDTGIVFSNLRKIKENKEEYLDFSRYVNLKNFQNYQEELFNSKIDKPTINQSDRFENHVLVRHYLDGVIEIYNLLPDEVFIEEINYKGKNLINAPINLKSYIDSDIPLKINTNIQQIADDEISVKTKYNNKVIETKNYLSLVKNVRNPLEKQHLTNISNLDFLKKTDKGFLIISGKWKVDSPLILNEPLEIEPGTSLSFADNSYLVVKGGLIAKGSIEKPIILKPSKNEWKGIYVYNSKIKSILEHVQITQTRELADGILKLTGGVNFYKSDVLIKDSFISNSLGEDGLNIIESEFLISGSKITNTYSDSFDSDYSNGKIINSEISNSGGDALDFSGSNVEISNVSIINVKDKGISSGERSKIFARNIMIKNSGVAIASKDGSNTKILGCEIENYSLYGVMTYIKKSFYDSPSMEINNCNIIGENKYLSQIGTTLKVDGIRFDTNEINTKELYSEGVMKK